MAPTTGESRHDPGCVRNRGVRERRHGPLAIGKGDRGARSHRRGVIYVVRRGRRSLSAAADCYQSRQSPEEPAWREDIAWHTGAIQGASVGRGVLR